MRRILTLILILSTSTATAQPYCLPKGIKTTTPEGGEGRLFWGEDLQALVGCDLRLQHLSVESDLNKNKIRLLDDSLKLAEVRYKLSQDEVKILRSQNDACLVKVKDLSSGPSGFPWWVVVGVGVFSALVASSVTIVLRSK